MPFRPASILGSHFGDRLSYGFLDLLGRLVTKRQSEPLQNLKATLPPRIQLSHATYPVRRAATIAPTVPTTFSTATSKIPTIQVLTFAKSALVALVPQHLATETIQFLAQLRPRQLTPHQCSSRPIGRLSQCEALVAPPEELPRRPNETVHRSYPRDSAKASPPRRHPPQPKRPLPPPPSCPLSPLSSRLRVRVLRSRPHAPARSPVPFSLSERASLLIAQKSPTTSPRTALQVVLTICTLGVCPPPPTLGVSMPLPASCCQLSPSPGISPRLSGVLSGVPLPLASRCLASLPRPTPPRAPYSRDFANPPKKSAKNPLSPARPLWGRAGERGFPPSPPGINTLMDRVPRAGPVDRRGTN